MIKHRNFASDNNAGMSPEAIRGLLEANLHHAPAYGDDPITAKAREALEIWFERPCGIYFVLGGTSANCLSIAASVKNYQSVICHQWAHIQNDECHAPGFFKPGVQLRLLEGENGKIASEDIPGVFDLSHGVHGTLPGLVSITQSTEAGTNYTLDEIESIASVAHNNNLLLHMDGARFANAAVALDVSPAEMTWKSGVDILSLGGVKNGLGFGEALVVFDPEQIDRMDYRMKQCGQLTSKMRYISGPWTAFIESGEWRRNALHSNAMAKLLSQKITEFDSIELTLPVESNAVFCKMPDEVYQKLTEKGWSFYPFPLMNAYRLMCSWDTTEQDINSFNNDLKEALNP